MLNSSRLSRTYLSSFEDARDAEKKADALRDQITALKNELAISKRNRRRLLVFPVNSDGVGSISSLRGLGIDGTSYDDGGSGGGDAAAVAETARIAYVAAYVDTKDAAEGERRLLTETLSDQQQQQQQALDRALERNSTDELRKKMDGKLKKTKACNLSIVVISTSIELLPTPCDAEYLSPWHGNMVTLTALSRHIGNPWTNFIERIKNLSPNFQKI